MVKRAFAEFINDRINDRLRTALNDGTSSAKAPSPPPSPGGEAEHGREVETLPDELEGFAIVRAMLRQATDSRRIAMRDTKSYCGILLDDNNRKPLCRLYFHGSRKYVGLFNERKEEKRHPIEDLNDLFEFSEQMKGMVTLYDENKIQDTREAEEPSASQ